MMFGAALAVSVQQAASIRMEVGGGQGGGKATSERTLHGSDLNTASVAVEDFLGNVRDLATNAEPHPKLDEVFFLFSQVFLFLVAIELLQVESQFGGKVPKPCTYLYELGIH